LERLSKNTDSLTFTLVEARPEFEAEMPFQIQGLNIKIQSKKWIAASINHTLSEQGFTSIINANLALP
jgi:phage protein D